MSMILESSYSILRGNDIPDLHWTGSRKTLNIPGVDNHRTFQGAKELFIFVCMVISIDTSDSRQTSRIQARMPVAIVYFSLHPGYVALVGATVGIK